MAWLIAGSRQVCQAGRPGIPTLHHMTATAAAGSSVGMHEFSPPSSQAPRRKAPPSVHDTHVSPCAHNTGARTVLVSAAHGHAAAAAAVLGGGVCTREGAPACCVRRRHALATAPLAPAPCSPLLPLPLTAATHALLATPPTAPLTTCCSLSDPVAALPQMLILYTATMWSGTGCWPPSPRSAAAALSLHPTPPHPTALALPACPAVRRARAARP